MFNKILGTFFSRIIVAVISFIVVILNTNTFGAEGTGTIALLILGLTILQLFSNFVGGGALVYLVPRKSFSQLLYLTYGWNIVSNVLGIILLYLCNLIPEGFELFLLILSLVNSCYYVNMTLMQGKDLIKQYNLYQLFQISLLILAFSLLLLLSKYFQREIKIELYLYSLLFSYLFPLLFSLRFVLKNRDEMSFKGIGKLLKEMFKLGLWVQLANFAQLMNYRLNYYFIEYFSGRKSLGLFELGTKLSEVVWIFPKSIALVQYAKLANCENLEYAKKLTAALLKSVFLFSFMAVIILSLIPAHWLSIVFGAEFYEAKKVIYCLGPGIVFLSCLSIFSHYFSGFGLYWINSIASFLGFCVTLVLGLLFIPKAAGIGYMETIQVAGVINSLSYFVSLLFSVILFFKKSTVTYKELLISKNDLILLKREISSFKNSFSKRQ